MTSSNLLPKSVVSWTPFTKITYSLTSTLLLGGVSSEMSEMLAAWLKSSFCTQIKLNSHLSRCAFFAQTGLVLVAIPVGGAQAAEHSSLSPVLLHQSEQSSRARE